MRQARTTAAVTRRPVRTITTILFALFAATVGMLTLPAAPGWAAPTTPPTPPFAVHVSPSPVVAGHTVTLSGSVGPDAAGSECSSFNLYSNVFGPTNDDFAYPVYATAEPTGTFTATTTIPRSKPAGTYRIVLRCGGASLGGGTLVVRAAPPTPSARVHVSPSRVAAGDTVTLSGSVGPDAARWECPGAVTLISKAFVHTDDFADVPAVLAAVKPDGTFTATTTIPRSKPAGTYTITGRCGGNLGVSATLVVRAAASPTTTPAPTVPTVTQPPAPQPQVAVPPVTGPPSQPATTAAAQPASSWIRIIPGLGALGSGTLAALGVWLLYRRRHPAGSSRQGRSRMAH